MMSNKVCDTNQLPLMLEFKSISMSPTNNEDRKIVNFNDYRTKKEKDFFTHTVDYLTKHLQK